MTYTQFINNREGQVMKIGDKVKYLGFDLPFENPGYLTIGKSYSVIAGQGDTGVFGEVHTEYGCEIVDDVGDVIFCYMPNSAHGRFMKEI